MGKRLDFALGVLNGAIGQHLSRTDNGLATPMRLHVHGRPISVGEASADGHVVVFVHGIMGTEQIWAAPDGSDYGTSLAEIGMRPLYVRYNSGRAIADNGASLAQLLSAIVDAHAVESLTLVGHSMGGLVIRSACDVGGAWLARTRRAIYVGTPHGGAPLERAGRFVHRVLGAIDEPYTRLVADVADLRSDGMKDLGRAHPVPLAPHVRHHVVAGTLSEARFLGAWLGDALVPLASATGGVEDPFVVRAGHNQLAHDPRVRDRIVAWCKG